MWLKIMPKIVIGGQDPKLDQDLAFLYNNFP